MLRTMNESTVAESAPGWEETRTAHFSLRAEPNSFAARMIDEIAERAEPALRALGGYLAAEDGVGWNVEDADKQAVARYGKGKVAPRLFETQEGQPAESAETAELSFLYFLRRMHGGAALARFAHGV